MDEYGDCWAYGGDGYGDAYGFGKENGDGGNFYFGSLEIREFAYG